ncbi:hypothetical protein [Paraburkholderia ribeironis]|uniref:hypothetical protein n=1 Tax=Paraburkholderia ribeironis TaxID=1247936 RepID=UPI0011776307|nr:hypothetical protein [Paraburkholderia ribeironis]
MIVTDLIDGVERWGMADCARSAPFTVSRRSKTFALRWRQLCGGIAQKVQPTGQLRTSDVAV